MPRRRSKHKRYWINNRRCRDISAKMEDRKSTRLNSSHGYISYAVFCLKKHIVDGLRNREGRAAADVRAGQHRDTLAGQRAGRQGLRREWHDRLEAGDRERGDRRARAVRGHSPRHAAGAREHLGSGRTREEDTMILLATAFSVVLLLAGLSLHDALPI